MNDLAIPFESIYDSDCAIVDANSLAELSKVSDNLHSTLNDRLALMLTDDIQGKNEYGLKDILPVLEYFVVRDFLVADFSAIDSIQTDGEIVKAAMNRINNSIPECAMVSTGLVDIDRLLFNYFSQKMLREKQNNDTDKCKLLEISKVFPLRFTHIPMKMSDNILRSIYRLTSVLEKVNSEICWRSYGHGEEKKYHDTRAFFGGSQINRSHLGVERTLFYYELSRSLGVPIVFHPARNIEVLNINKTLIDAFHLIKRKLKEGFEIPIEIGASDIGINLAIKQPALAMYIIRQAGAHRISIVESLRKMRETKLAKEFRKWLNQIQHSLIDSSTSAKMNVMKLLRELEITVERWVSDLDINSGVCFKRRKIDISKLPKIGILLSIIGDVSIKDPILNPKAYLTFISSWYK